MRRRPWDYCNYGTYGTRASVSSFDVPAPRGAPPRSQLVNSICYIEGVCMLPTSIQQQKDSPAARTHSDCRRANGRTYPSAVPLPSPRGVSRSSSFFSGNGCLHEADGTADVHVCSHARTHARTHVRIEAGQRQHRSRNMRWKGGTHPQPRPFHAFMEGQARKQLCGGAVDIDMIAPTTCAPGCGGTCSTCSVSCRHRSGERHAHRHARRGRIRQGHMCGTYETDTRVSCRTCAVLAC